MRKTSQLRAHPVDLQLAENPCIMVTLSNDKGKIRLRKFQDETPEFTAPCHFQAISALKLSDCGEFIATACEDGQFIRVLGWFKNHLSKTMLAPISLYLVEVNTRSGLICELQFSASYKQIAVLVKRSKEQQRDMNQSTNMIGTGNPQFREPDRASIIVCDPNHQSQVFSGIKRHIEIQSEPEPPRRGG